MQGLAWESESPLLRVFVVDSDPSACRDVQRACEQLGAAFTVCGDGADALFLIGHQSPDVVFIDASLPGLSCASVIESLRRHTSVPIVVGVDADRTSAAAPAIAAGGTRLLNRPYELRQLQPLLEAWLAQAEERMQLTARVTLGSLELDSLAYVVRASGRPLALTLKEFELLRYLMLHADRVVTPEQLREAVWSSSEEGPTANTIAVHVRRIRAQLGDSVRIVSVRGVGYRLTLTEPVGASTPGALGHPTQETASGLS
jgi:two-component system, OmpR family, response regulator